MHPQSEPPLRRLPIIHRAFRGTTIGVIYVLLFLALDSFTRRFSLLPSISPWYPPSGLSLGLITAFGPAYAPWILLVNLLSNRLVWALPAGWDAVFGLSLLPCVVYGLAGTLLRQRLGPSARLSNARDVLLLAAVSIAAPLPVALGAGFLGTSAGIVPPERLGEAIRQLWVGEAIGIVILVPFMLVNVLPGLRRLETLRKRAELRIPWRALRSGGRWIDVLAVAGGLGLLLAMIFRWEIFGQPPLVYPLFVPLIWVGLRFGLSGATAFVPAINVAVAVISFPYTISGLDVVELQTFMIAFSVTGLLLGAVVSDQRRINHALSEREAQYRHVFESTSDALLVIDHQGRLLESNPAASALLGHSQEAFAKLDPETLLSFHAETDAPAVGLSDRLGRTSFARATATRADGSGTELEVRIGPLGDQKDGATLVILHDVTEEVHSRRLLESRVERRTRELSLLFDVSRVIAASVEPDPPLNIILERMHRVVAFDAAWIRLLDNGHLEVAAAWPPEALKCLVDVPLQTVHGRTMSEMISKRKVVHIASLEAPGDGNTDLARGIVALSGDCLEELGTWMGIPLEVRGSQPGLLELVHNHQAAFAPGEVHLAEGFAQLAAVAVANARLHQQAAERLEEAIRRSDVASGLREVLSALNSELPLDQVKQSIVDQAAALLGTSTIALYEIDPHSNQLVVTASRGLPSGFREVVQIPIGAGAVGRAFEMDQPILLTPADESEDSNLAMLPIARARNAYAQLLENHQAILAVPVRVRGEPFGGLSLYYSGPRQITPEETSLAIAFADQAALAIENNRLHAKALELASLQERQKLSRELHDSVSQALYGIALGAQTARTLLDRQRGDAVREPLDYILDLARTGLAEMRALIFELRPDSLATEGLVAALRKQAESLASRHGIDMKLELDSEPDLPLSVKECIYRVGAEALHNIGKHAQAQHASLALLTRGKWMSLKVTDDGRGFSPQSTFPGHLGVVSMRERAAAVSGDLQIVSHPGQGTQIELRVPLTAPEPEQTGPEVS